MEPMSIVTLLLLAAWLGLLALWLAGAVVVLRSGRSALPTIAAALIFPVTLSLLDAGGWWTEIPRSVMFGSVATALLWLSFGYIARQMGSGVARVLAGAIRFVPVGFFVGLGVLSLRNGGPLGEGLAWAAVGLGVLVAVGGLRR